MYVLSEEGELEKDRSDDELIPRGMLWGSFLVQNGKIYAVEIQTKNGELRREVVRAWLI